MSFSKNAEKYVKYDAREVGEIIQSFFDAAAWAKIFYPRFTVFYKINHQRYVSVSNKFFS